MAVTRTCATIVGILLVAAAVPAQEAPERAAVVNGKPILAADVDAKLGNNLAKLQEQIYALREKQLEAMIDQELLAAEAARQGVTIAALVQAEITSHVTLATSADAARFFEENKARLQGDLPALEEQIKNYLNAQQIQTRQKAYFSTLRAKSDVKLLLTPPPVFRADVTTAGAPVRGDVDATVTIVEFSDFHCPYCRRIQPIIDQVRAKYGDRVRLIYRDMPLDNLHPQATVVAQAARCANEQGKFWEYHDTLFKNEPDGAPATLDRFAGEVGLDVTAFAACRTSGKYSAPVLASTQEGSRLGISGTPTFFINGRILVGAQPVEAFARIIDEELAAGSQPPSTGGR
jgi:protein-disulfide isomerase